MSGPVSISSKLHKFYVACCIVAQLLSGHAVERVGPDGALWEEIDYDSSTDLTGHYERDIKLYPSAALLKGPCNLRANMKNFGTSEFRSYYLKGEIFQRKAIRYYEGKGPPPMDEVWLIQRSVGEAAHRLSWSDHCFGTFMLSQFLFAEYLYALDFELAEKTYQSAISHDEDYFTEFIPLEEAREHTTKIRQKAIDLREKLQGKDGNKKIIDIVICHCHKPLTWLSWFKDIPKVSNHYYNMIFYSRCSKTQEMFWGGVEDGSLDLAFFVGSLDFYDLPDAPLPENLFSANPNVSFASDLYCWANHMTMKYHHAEYADFTFFLHDNPFDHIHWHHLRNVFQTLENGHFDQPYYPLAESRLPLLRFDQDFCETMFLALVLQFKEKAASSYCCGQFVVRKDRFDHTPFDVWSLLLSTLADFSLWSHCGTLEPQLKAGFAVEVLWHWLFGEDAVPPIREEDSNLPLFLKVNRQFQHSVAPELPIFGDSWGDDFPDTVY